MILQRALRLALMLAGLTPATACADLLTNTLIEAGRIPVTATPLPLSPMNPETVQVGALTYLGGIELSGRGAGFGGLSALAVLADGERFLALSDIGYWVTGRLRFDAAGRLVGAGDAEAGRLRDLGGAAVGRMYRDAEALAVDPAGRAVIGFEREHRLWRYDMDERGGLPGLPTALPAPPGIEAAARNQGIEGLALLTDGRRIAFAEGLAEAEGHLAWIGTGPDEATDWQPFHYPAAQGYAVSDAAALPNGDLLVLERGFALLAGARARLVHVPGSALVPGTVVSGTLLATLAPPLNVDNFEALAVIPAGDGAVKLVLASDDNFRPFQRTLLMAFLWQPD